MREVVGFATVVARDEVMKAACQPACSPFPLISVRCSPKNVNHGCDRYQKYLALTHWRGFLGCLRFAPVPQGIR